MFDADYTIGKLNSGAELQMIMEAHNAALVRAEKTEAERDAAWRVGRDAAAEVAETKADNHGWNYHLPSVGREIAKAIRALTPPEDKP